MPTEIESESKQYYRNVAKLAQGMLKDKGVNIPLKQIFCDVKADAAKGASTKTIYSNILAKYVNPFAAVNKPRRDTDRGPQSRGMRSTNNKYLAYNQPDKYVYQTAAELHPHMFAENIAKRMRQRIPDYSDGLERDTYKAVIQLEKKRYWWRDILKAFVSACSYHDLNSTQDYLRIAVKLAKAAKPMSIQSYDLTTDK